MIPQRGVAARRGPTVSRRRRYVGDDLLAPRGPAGKGGPRDFRMAMRVAGAKEAVTEVQPLRTGYYQVNDS